MEQGVTLVDWKVPWSKYQSTHNRQTVKPVTVNPVFSLDVYAYTNINYMKKKNMRVMFSVQRKMLTASD